MRTSSIAHCGSGGGGRNDQQGGGREGKRVSAALWVSGFERAMSRWGGGARRTVSGCSSIMEADMTTLMRSAPLRSRATRTAPTPVAPSSLLIEGPPVVTALRHGHSRAVTTSK